MGWLEQINLRNAYKESLPRFRKRIAARVLLIFCALALLIYHSWDSRPPDLLLNLAFDASRPVFTELDQAWSETSGQRISSAHTGSISQTEALAGGLVADTICVSSPYELDYLSQRDPRLLQPSWRTRFPANSSPFSSSIVFVVRRDAASEISDWPDLFQANQRIAVPDPRISGAGRYAYLALAYNAEQAVGANPLRMAEALRRVHFLPYAARRSTEVFAADSQFGALLTWESEALRLLQNPLHSEFVLVYPSYSLQIEVVVALAEAHVEKRGTREAADDYLRFLFSAEGQRIIAQAGFRPRDAAYDDTRDPAPNILHRVETLFGSWQNAHSLHFGPNGSFSRLLAYRQARSGGTE